MNRESLQNKIAAWGLEVEFLKETTQFLEVIIKPDLFLKFANITKR